MANKTFGDSLRQTMSPNSPRVKLWPFLEAIRIYDTSSNYSKSKCKFAKHTALISSYPVDTYWLHASGVTVMRNRGWPNHGRF